MKIRQIDVLRLLDGCRVLPETIAQSPALRRVEREAALARALGNGLTHIYRLGKGFILVLLHDRRVRGEVSGVVDGINAGADEIGGFRKRGDRPKQERLSDAATEIELVQGIVRSAQR